jgi:hypothetical protein
VVAVRFNMTRSDQLLLIALDLLLEALHGYNLRINNIIVDSTEQTRILVKAKIQSKHERRFFQQYF